MKIGYKIGGSFEDCCGLGKPDIGFEILFPHIYKTYDEAMKNIANISADMVNENSEEEVVIVLSEKGVPIDVIKWEEYWKYKCNQQKKESIDSGFTNARKDYEPCSKKFDDIFNEYTCKDNRSKFSMQYLAYWIEPIIIMDNDGSFTYVKNN